MPLSHFLFGHIVQRTFAKIVDMVRALFPREVLTEPFCLHHAINPLRPLSADRKLRDGSPIQNHPASHHRDPIAPAARPPFDEDAPAGIGKARHRRAVYGSAPDIEATILSFLAIVGAID
jgi:hypothetical protein